MIKAVLFDLDGTLLDRDASLKNFIEAQYNRLNEWLGHISKSRYAERFIELDARGYVWKDKVYQQLAEEFRISGISPEDLLQDYVAEFKHYCVPFPGLIAMLEELKRKSISLGMITNGRGQFQLDNIQALGIESYFDIILISEWEEMKKPDPEIFKKAMKELQVQPADCLFVGDHPKNDVKAARSVGMKGVWKIDPQWTDVEADYQINELQEVLDLLKEKTAASL